MTCYQEILSAVTSELELHRCEIERNEIDHRIDLSWVSLKVVLGNGDSRPMRVYFQAESVRNVKNFPK